MKKQVWQLQEAKNRFSHVVNKALTDGPQVITRRGKEVAVVISSAQYHRLTAKRASLTEFFRASPLVGADIDLGRDKSAPRPDPER